MGSLAKDCFQTLVNRISIKTLETLPKCLPSCIFTQGCQTGLFQAKILKFGLVSSCLAKKNLVCLLVFLASSQAGWPQKFCLAFWLIFGLLIGAYEENIAIPFLSATHLQIFAVNAISDTRILILVIFEEFWIRNSVFE